MWFGSGRLGIRAADTHVAICARPQRHVISYCDWPASVPPVYLLGADRAGVQQECFDGYQERRERAVLEKPAPAFLAVWSAARLVCKVGLVIFLKKNKKSI